MKKYLSLIVILAVFLIFLASAAYFSRRLDQKNRTPLNIYVPCGLTLPFKELAFAFEDGNHNIKVEGMFENTVILTKFILKNGKRPDLFISPGEKEIGLLRQSSLIDDSSLKAFGQYELILIAPAGAQEIKGLEDLLQERVKVVAIANPDYNSVGFYAMSALKKLGYWDKLQQAKTIMFTNTPLEAITYVATGKANAGIHYNVCPFQTDAGKVTEGAIKIAMQLPPDSHPPIYNYIAILNTSAHKKIAQNFIDFMFSAKGRQILSKYGLAQSANVALQNTAAVSPKVIIQAYYPFNEEHIFIKDYLETLPVKYNGQVKVECVDFRNDEGYVLWRKTGLACGGILINGKYKFTINQKGSPKEVEFLKRIDLTWTKDDLDAAINQELEKK